MSRIRFRIPTWKEGEGFMINLAAELDLTLEAVDADLHLTGDGFVIKCHMDDRSFASVMVKIMDASMEPVLKKFCNKYLQ